MHIMKLNLMEFIHVLMFCIFCASVLSSQCPPQYPFGQKQPISQLQSGVITLTAQPEPKRTYYANTTIKKELPPYYEVTVSLSFIENYNDPNKIDFLVRAVKQSSFFVIVLSLSQQSKWRSVQLYYLASSRKDFMLGNYMPDISELLLPYQKNQTRKIKTSNFLPQRQWNYKNNDLITFLFISGVRISSKQLDLNIESSYINLVNKKLEIIVNFIVVSQKQSVQLLYLGYVICRNYNNPFQVRKISYLPQAVMKQKRGNIYEVNRLYAFTKISPTFLNQNNQNQFLVPFSKNFRTLAFAPPSPTTIQEGIQFILLQKVSMPLMDEFNNPFAVYSCVSYAQCEEIGGYVIKNKSKYICFLCSGNSKYDQTAQKCVCQQGFFMNSKKDCVSYASLCGPNQIYSQGNCYTLSLYNYKTLVASMKN